MNDEAEKTGSSHPAQHDVMWPAEEDWPEEAHAAATFFAAALFLIQGWNRLEDLGWVEAWGSESQRAILNLDHLDAFSLCALSGRERRD